MFAVVSNPTLFKLALFGCFALGTIFFVAGCYLRSKTRRLVDSALVAKGTVVAIETSKMLGGPRTVVTVVFHPVFTFRDANGIEHRVRSGMGSNPAPHKIGDKVEVLYQPQSPEQAIIDSKEYIQMAWIFLSVGVVAMAIATIIFLKN